MGDMEEEKEEEMERGERESGEGQGREESKGYSCVIVVGADSYRWYCFPL